MKMTLMIFVLICCSATLLNAQDGGNPAPIAVQAKVTALNQKYAVLFDTESDAKEAVCGRAMGQLKDDAELVALKAELTAALEVGRQAVISNQNGGSNQVGVSNAQFKTNAVRIAQAGQALQAKQFEKIVALYPTLQPYLEAKAKHEQERLALLKEFAGNMEAQRLIAEGTKRRQ